MTLPLVLISQIQRSGGTLLSQLFDGHPECATYPHELCIGLPKKWDWPDLPLDSTPKRWFRLLCDRRLGKMARAGYSKSGQNPHAREQVLPFTFDVDRFKGHFLEQCRQNAVQSQRDVLDHYFAAFFDTWTDRSGNGEERYIVAFTPRVHMNEESVERMRRDYPDGRIISVIRDPLTWFVSASQHDSDTYSAVDSAMDEWRASAEASLRLAAARPEAALALLYEDLLSAPRRVMSGVARFLGIRWDDGLLRPTYCGHLMIANSSFTIETPGLSLDPLTRPIDLPPEKRSYIDETAEPFYRECVARIRGSWVPGFLGSEVPGSEVPGSEVPGSEAPAFRGSSFGWSRQ